MADTGPAKFWKPVGATYQTGGWSILVACYDEDSQSWRFKEHLVGNPSRGELDPGTGEWSDD